MKEAVVLDFSDLAAQAARIRMDAETKGQAIIAQAEQRAAELMKEVQAKAQEAGHAAGHQQGLEEGIKAGQTQAYNEHHEVLSRIAEGFADTAASWEAARLELLRDARESVLQFAVKMGEKLTFRQIEIDDTVIVDQAEAALRFVLAESQATVRVHPADRPALEQALPKLLATFQTLEQVDLIDDDTLQRGGCHVAFGQGSVDATLATQVQRLTDLILPPASA